MGTNGINKVEAELAKLSQTGVTELCGLMLGRKEVGSSKLSLWKLGVSRLDRLSSSATGLDGGS